MCPWLFRGGTAEGHGGGGIVTGVAMIAFGGAGRAGGLTRRCRIPLAQGPRTSCGKTLNGDGPESS